jgi:hypothetical protein
MFTPKDIVGELAVFLTIDLLISIRRNADLNSKLRQQYISGFQNEPAKVSSFTRLLTIPSFANFRGKQVGQISLRK